MKVVAQAGAPTSIETLAERRSVKTSARDL
jgi:hypothetical protein